jgi:hypothetical protein
MFPQYTVPAKQKKRLQQVQVANLSIMCSNYSATQSQMKVSNSAANTIAETIGSHMTHGNPDGQLTCIHPTLRHHWETGSTATSSTCKQDASTINPITHSHQHSSERACMHSYASVRACTHTHHGADPVHFPDCWFHPVQGSKSVSARCEIQAALHTLAHNTRTDGSAGTNPTLVNGHMLIACPAGRPPTFETKLLHSPLPNTLSRLWLGVSWADTCTAQDQNASGAAAVGLAVSTLQLARDVGPLPTAKLLHARQSTSRCWQQHNACFLPHVGKPTLGVVGNMYVT